MGGCRKEDSKAIIMETILAYLRQLEANNNKPWFDAHKSEYQEARAHFSAIVEKLMDGVIKIAIDNRY